MEVTFAAGVVAPTDPDVSDLAPPEGTSEDPEAGDLSGGTTQLLWYPEKRDLSRPKSRQPPRRTIQKIGLRDKSDLCMEGARRKVTIHPESSDFPRPSTGEKVTVNPDGGDYAAFLPPIRDHPEIGDFRFEYLMQLPKRE